MSRWVVFVTFQVTIVNMLFATCPPAIPALPTLPVPVPQDLPTRSCNGPAPAALANYLPIVIVNNSNLSASDIYVTALVNSASQYLAFSSGSGHILGSITNFTPTTYLSSSLYSYQLSFFENLVGNEYVFYIPNTGNSSTHPDTVMKSSRILISLNQPLTYFIDNTGALQVPSEFDAKNDNYYTLNDKVEFDLGSNGLNRLNLNLTGVDFFGLPLRVEADYQFLYGSTYHEACAVTGLPSAVSFSDVFSGYTGALADLAPPFNTYWSGLVATYTNPDSTVSNLRIYAPATAMGSTQTQTNPSLVTFPTNYFLNSSCNPAGCTWFNAVWQGMTLSGETAFYQQTKPTPYLKLSADIDAGTGVAEGNEFSDGSFRFTIYGTGTSPTPDKGSTITFPIPTSTKAFFTGAVSDYVPAISSSASADTNAQVLKGFATSIIAGFFPINCAVSPSINIDKEYLQNHSSEYFENNAILSGALSGCSCVANVPWYDFYSRTLLTIGTPNLFYTSAYSDYLGTDGTIVITSLHDHNADAVVSVYLNDCTMSTTPDPYSDSTTYTVNIGIPSNTHGTQLATIGYGTSASGPFTPYSSGTFSSSGTDLFVQVTYSSGVYNGGTFVSQVAPAVRVFHPILPGGGNVVTNGTTTTVYVGASP